MGDLRMTGDESVVCDGAEGSSNLQGIAVKDVDSIYI